MTRFRMAVTRYLPILVLVLAAAEAPGFALGDWVGIEVQYWGQAMEGSARVDGNLLPGTDFDLQEDLGIERTDHLPAARVWLHWLKRNYIYATSYDSAHRGDQLLTDPIIFNDQVFAPGERVQSRLETELLSLQYGYNLVDLKVLKIGFRVGADRLSFEGTVDSATTGTRSASSENATFPVVGLGFQVHPLPLLRFTGEISGVDVKTGGNDVNFWDSRVQAEIYLNHFVGLHAGYRRVHLDIDLEDFGSGNVAQKGPYAGVTLRF